LIKSFASSKVRLSVPPFVSISSLKMKRFSVKKRPVAWITNRSATVRKAETKTKDIQSDRNTEEADRKTEKKSKKYRCETKEKMETRRESVTDLFLPSEETLLSTYWTMAGTNSAPIPVAMKLPFLGSLLWNFFSFFLDLL
jgi:hypothetical protein